jgi:hypothetical protein
MNRLDFGGPTAEHRSHRSSPLAPRHLSTEPVDTPQSGWRWSWIRAGVILSKVDRRILWCRRRGELPPPERSRRCGWPQDLNAVPPKAVWMGRGLS